MREKFNVNLTNLDKLYILIHGGYSVGKTHLMGDFLKYYSVRGPVKYVNIKGEDGSMSLSTFDLGEIGETVETWKDIMDLLSDCRKEKCVAVGFDSLKVISRVSMFHTLGEDRMPKGGGGKGSRDANEWTPVHFDMEGLVSKLRHAAPYVMCVSPSDRSAVGVNEDQKIMITPDLPGRQAGGNAHLFDMVGYLNADLMSDRTIKRTLRFAPNTASLTRQRLGTAIVEDIVLPQGPGGWKLILDRINKSLGIKETNS